MAINYLVQLVCKNKVLQDEEFDLLEDLQGFLINTFDWALTPFQKRLLNGNQPLTHRFTNEVGTGYTVKVKIY